MASKYRIEHVARVPRGWKVRTVTQSGGHEVRIAFPPGRREKGSGHVVEILHPSHENPGYCPGRTRMQNPAELVLMGANPIEENRSRGAGRSNLHPATGHRSPRYAVHWDTGNISQAFASESEARSMLDRFHGKGKIIRVNPMPLRRSNPADLADQSRARDIREGFMDHPSQEDWYQDEPHMPAGNYAHLGTGGEVVGEQNGRRAIAYAHLAIKPERGGGVLVIDLDDPTLIFLSSTDRRQLWIAGAYVLTGSEIAQFTDSRESVVDLGECREIGYIAVKYHPQLGSEDAGRALVYEHPFEAPRPHVFYDRAKRRLLLRGGGYRVEDAGIVG